MVAQQSSWYQPSKMLPNNSGFCWASARVTKHLFLLIRRNYMHTLFPDTCIRVAFRIKLWLRSKGSSICSSNWYVYLHIWSDGENSRARQGKTNFIFKTERYVHWLIPLWDSHILVSNCHELTISAGEGTKKLVKLMPISF